MIIQGCPACHARASAAAGNPARFDGLDAVANRPILHAQPKHMILDLPRWLAGRLVPVGNRPNGDGLAGARSPGKHLPRAKPWNG